MAHTNTHGLVVAEAVALVNNNLRDLGFFERDADMNDFANDKTPGLRFKTGTSMGEITTQVVRKNRPMVPLRATSWAGVDRMLLEIRGYIDQETSR